VLERFLPLPREALFLGIASDGWPVLLNLFDPTTGPVLLVGESGSGKTFFLQNVALAVSFIHPSENLQYGILTADPDEWRGLTNTQSCIEIFDIASQRSVDFLRSLHAWVNEHNHQRQTVLVLLDGLEMYIDAHPQFHQLLHWLFKNGPANLVWPIVTLNAELLSQVQDWVEEFNTLLLGRTASEWKYPGYLRETKLSTSLLTRGEYLLREGNGWLKFHTPALKA
jgi:hypothetical protein